jgi:hypothetical protein
MRFCENHKMERKQVYLTGCLVDAQNFEGGSLVDNVKPRRVAATLEAAK